MVLLETDSNSNVMQMRVLRAFRLFRLLGKLGDIKKIVTAVAMSIAPTLQALVCAQHLYTPCTGTAPLNGKLLAFPHDLYTG